MPMDTTDYDRIQEIVDKAFRRMENQVALMMPKDESVLRHLAASDRITQVEKRLADLSQGMTESVKWSMAEHEKIRQANNDRIDKLENNVSGQLESVVKSIDGIKESISENRATTLRYIISVIISFLLGGGALGIIEYIRSLHP